MKKLTALILVLLAVSGCAGTGERPASTGTDIGPTAFTDAQTVVDKLFDAYRFYTRDSFSRMLSTEANAQPGLLDRIETDYFNGNLIELNYFIDGAQRANNTLLVKVKWEKRSQPYSGTTPVMSKGRAELTFKESKGAWLLYQIAGDNPF